jgi:hypothetical protein
MDMCQRASPRLQCACSGHAMCHRLGGDVGAVFDSMGPRAIPQTRLGMLERPRGRFAEESELLKLCLVASGMTWTDSTHCSPEGREDLHNAETTCSTSRKSLAVAVPHTRFMAKTEM